jgi:hypothetical protein
MAASASGNDCAYTPGLRDAVVFRGSAVGRSMAPKPFVAVVVHESQSVDTTIARN